VNNLAFADNCFEEVPCLTKEELKRLLLKHGSLQDSYAILQAKFHMCLRENLEIRLAKGFSVDEDQDVVRLAKSYFENLNSNITELEKDNAKLRARARSRYSEQQAEIDTLKADFKALLKQYDNEKSRVEYHMNLGRECFEHLAQTEGTEYTQIMKRMYSGVMSDLSRQQLFTQQAKEQLSDVYNSIHDVRNELEQSHIKRRVEKEELLEEIANLKTIIADQNAKLFTHEMRSSSFKQELQHQEDSHYRVISIYKRRNETLVARSKKLEMMSVDSRQLFAYNRLESQLKMEKSRVAKLAEANSELTSKLALRQIFETARYLEEEEEDRREKLQWKKEMEEMEQRRMREAEDEDENPLKPRFWIPPSKWIAQELSKDRERAENLATEQQKFEDCDKRENEDDVFF
jgi:hypothetical protein